MTHEPLVILHAVPGAWLPATQTWLHDQVRLLPDPVVSHVVCDRVEHADRFRVPNVHAAEADPARRRLTDGWRSRVRSALGRGRHRDLVIRTARTTGADVLHSHFGPEGWRNNVAARRLGLAHVVSFYGYDVGLPRRHPRWARRYRALFDHVDRVLCEGYHMAARLRDLGCPPEKVTVHRLGIDLDAIPFRPRAWTPGTTLRVLLAAAFRPKKGLPDAIEALGRLRREVDLEITIIGDATGGAESEAEKRRILDAIARHDLADRVAPLGFRSRRVLHEQAARHHLLLAPSRTADDGDTEGGAPVTLIEMAASGMPIVSTHHADIPGVLRDGETAFLARPGDPHDLAAKIRTTLDAAPRWPEMLAAGRRWIEARFDARAQAERLTTLYRQARLGLRYHDSPPRSPAARPLAAAPSRLSSSA
jgi:colanic acid/amylovoran biosynthesis glycosyltransferase